MEQQAYVRNAPAKINWFLDITSRREDGYHELSTLMQKVSLQDQVRVFTTAQTIEGSSLDLDIHGLSVHFSLTSDFPILPERNNTVLRALELFGKEVNLSELFPSGSISVCLEKHIPVQGGMGGGSADGAAMLGLLRDLASEKGLAIPEERLMEMAKELGADVPFCLHKARLAYCTGIGEIIEPLAPLAQAIPLLFVFPGVEVSTKTAFNQYDSLNKSERRSIPTSRSERFGQSLREGKLEALNELGVNTFSYFMDEELPKLKEYKEALRDFGASYAAMSGSGPTLFGAFSSGEARDVGKSRFSQLYPELTLSSCETL